jgi:hypothetical protein
MWRRELIANKGFDGDEPTRVLCALAMAAVCAVAFIAGCGRSWFRTNRK